jgi:cholesterol transport system auxiliary component
MNPVATPTRRLVLGLTSAIAVVLVPGCAALLPDKPVRAAVYDFGPGPLSLAHSAPGALPALTLAEIETGPALDSTAMLYRLAYLDATELRPYAQARWSMPPAQLLRQKLSGALEGQRPVLGGAPSGPGLLLRVELEEFVHLFETPERSAGLVRLRATVLSVDQRGERLLAQRRVVALRPATSQDATGGVRALAAASDAAVLELATWLLGVR